MNEFQMFLELLELPEYSGFSNFIGYSGYIELVPLQNNLSIMFDDECCSSQALSMLNMIVNQDDTSLANNFDQHIH